MAEKTSVDIPPPPAYSSSSQPDAAMPTTYESNPPPTYSQPAPGKVTLDRDYIVSISGLLVAVEAVLSFLSFVCAAADRFFAAWGGGGWIIFVGVVTFLCQVALFLMYMFGFMYRMPSAIPVSLSEFIYYIVVTVFFFISAVIASTKWWMSPAVRACTMFCWFAFATYGADTVRKFMSWRDEHPSGPDPTVTSRTTTTTTTATTSNVSNITTEPHY